MSEKNKNFKNILKKVLTSHTMCDIIYTEVKERRSDGGQAKKEAYQTGLQNNPNNRLDRLDCRFAVNPNQ